MTPIKKRKRDEDEIQEPSVNDTPSPSSASGSAAKKLKYESLSGPSAEPRSKTKPFSTDSAASTDKIGKHSDKSYTVNLEQSTIIRNNDSANDSAFVNSSPVAGPSEYNRKEIGGPIAKDVHIFEGVLLYVPAAVRDYVKEELRWFALWGGTELNSTKLCNHMLHKEATVAGDWKIIR